MITANPNPTLKPLLERHFPFMDEAIFEFAMVISVAPQSEAAWERALYNARHEPGITMTVRSPSLVFFIVSAEQEYLAIERAEKYLEQIGRAAGVRCVLNPQPSSEV